MNLNDFDYILPKELIAQFPADKRDNSNLLVLNKESGAVEFKKFFNLVEYLNKGDVLVINNTKVIPARLFGCKQSGAKIEVLLLSAKPDGFWEVLLKPSKRIKENDKVLFNSELSAEVKEKLDDGKWLVKFIFEGDFENIIKKIGIMPLPPYILRKETDESTKKFDSERYQTVYAQNPGSVAAPTAGLHFTSELLRQIEEKGVQICPVTLNVGLGTFKPVKSENIEEHKMEYEYYEISPQTASIINNAKQKGSKIFAVGTTSVRTLETVYGKYGEIKASSGQSNLFIYPGFEFKVIDGLVTNFHLPKSTLLMLVAALAGRKNVLNAYQKAVENEFRFYSYGDAMLIQGRV